MSLTESQTIAALAIGVGLIVLLEICGRLEVWLRHRKVTKITRTTKGKEKHNA